MKTYIALLRGINVGGHKKIRMADLRSLMYNSGFQDVQTYIQSGNLILSASEDVESISLKISEAIEQKYGWEVPVLVKTTSEIKSILEHCPFPEDQKLKSYFCLLSSTPSTENMEKCRMFQFPGESFIITPQCVYIYSEVAAQKSKISNNFFENHLKVAATTRNYNTLQKLLSLSA
jgi:uncharacterized protein (DUF1697 family)